MGLTWEQVGGYLRQARGGESGDDYKLSVTGDDTLFPPTFVFFSLHWAALGRHFNCVTQK